MTIAQALSLKTPGQSIDTYMQALKKIPMLDLDEERRLAEKLRDNNDIEAARQLVLSHLRFVVHIAHTYRGYGLPHADLIQEGNIGLMKAVNRFDPTVGVRLVSFAVHWIRAEMHEYILRNWRIVKIATTKSQRKLFFNLRGAKKNLNWLNVEEAENIAADLNVSVKDVREMESRLSSHDTAFDGAQDDDSENDSVSPALYLEDYRFDPQRVVEEDEWTEHNSLSLEGALALLDGRSQDIVRKRWLNEDEKPTLQQLSQKYKVSAERIRQIEQNAINKLRQNLLKAA